MGNWLSAEPGLSSVDTVQIPSGQRDDNRRGGEETEGKGLWWPRAQVSLNLEIRNLDRRNLRSMLKILYAAYPCLSQLISAQFALEMRLAARNRQKSIQPPILKSVQGHPRSLNSVTIDSQCIYDFLLVINSNLSSISHRYWDTATYWLKIANLSTPSHLALSFGVTPFEFMEKLYGSWN